MSKQTSFTRFDSGQCVECWKCIEACANKVIGKVNLPWHKHVRIVSPIECVGCMKCVKVCNVNAMRKRERGQ